MRQYDISGGRPGNDPLAAGRLRLPAVDLPSLPDEPLSTDGRALGGRAKRHLALPGEAGATLLPGSRACVGGVGGRVVARGRWAVEPALLVLIGAMVLWAIVFGRLVVLRHDYWRTIDFDLGIHDQSIWLLSRFKDFVTVRGLPVFGHHATFGYFFLVPLAWLGAGPNTWNVLQVVAIASSALPIYYLARDRLKRPWLACDARRGLAAPAAAAVLRLGDLPPRGHGHPVPALGVLGHRARPPRASTGCWSSSR